jgi:hypothetical protein
VAANGEVGRVIGIDTKDETVLVSFPPRHDGGPTRNVTVGKVKYRRGFPVDERTGLQRRWVRKQIPLEKGYARTAHKAQGTTLSRPTHIDCVDVVYMGNRVPPSMIYVLLGRARSVTQIHLARDKFGKVFDIWKAKPDAKALQYHTNLVAEYRPLQGVLDALGRDDMYD